MDQPREWTYPYTVYAAQYDAVFPLGSEAGQAHARIREEWGRVLPQLILAGSDEEFDALFAQYLETRDSLGFALVQEEATRQMREAKERLSILE